ncbi:hypothetical protein VF03_20970 [Nostoc linckia z2]|nr:hypothetical protein VF03_20970 [Nostoc linckia z2]
MYGSSIGGRGRGKGERGKGKGEGGKGKGERGRGKGERGHDLKFSLSIMMRVTLPRLCDRKTYWRV